jgi:hypothetical protein
MCIRLLVLELDDVFVCRLTGFLLLGELQLGREVLLVESFEAFHFVDTMRVVERSG